MTSSTSGKHIVSAYDRELKRLDNDIIRMGGLAESQINRAVEAVVQRDSRLAEAIIADDDLLDDLNSDIDDKAVRLLALRQPMAEDLRQIIAAIKISSDLERIGDYATNIAKRSIRLSSEIPVGPVQAIPAMTRLAQQMLKEVLDAYVARDAAKAYEAWTADDRLDDAYSSLFGETLRFAENPEHITACTQVLFIAKNIERIGDHVTNVAETIYFMVHGRRLRDARESGGEEPPPGSAADSR